MREYQKKWGEGQAVLYKPFRHYIPVQVWPIVDRIKQKGLQRIEALDIGAGEGSVALQVIHSLQKAGVKVISWEAVDVSKEQLDSFKAKAKGISEPRFDFHLQAWNDFFPKRRYDFVLARHSWYGVTKWRKEPRETNALMKLYSAIKERGLGLIVLTTKNDVLFSVPNKFQGDTTTEDVLEALERIKIKFHCLRVKRPLPNLLEGGELTEAGQGIFRYMLHTENISSRKAEIEDCLAKWFTGHGEWFSQSDFIWIEK